jgi:hypothetical protein
MQLTHGLIIASVLVAGGVPAAAQEPPPSLPTQTAPSQSPVAPAPQPAPPVTALAPAPAAAPLTAADIRQRREAIFLLEGVLMKAVNLAAQNTAGEIQRIQPGIAMFSTSPVKAHGTYLEGFGVFFQVEIPSVIPSVASLIETIGRERVRPNTSPAQPTTLAGGSLTPPADAVLNPDAHYVQSVKDQLVSFMVTHSPSLQLRPEEWLVVSARDGSEAPGQVAQPSTMTLRIKGSDLADFVANRINGDEVRRRVQIRGF